jgi:hypothetical protein
MTYTTQELVDRCLRQERHFEMLDATHPRKTDQPAPAATTSGTSTRNNTRTERRPLGVPHPDKKDIKTLPAKYKALGPVDQKERKRCMDAGACLKCRELGHQQFETELCPLAHYAKKELKATWALNTSGTGIQGNGGAASLAQ